MSNATAALAAISENSSRSAAAIPNRLAAAMRLRISEAAIGMVPDNSTARSRMAASWEESRSETFSRLIRASSMPIAPFTPDVRPAPAPRAVIPTAVSFAIVRPAPAAIARFAELTLLVSRRSLRIVRDTARPGPVTRSRRRITSVDVRLDITSPPTLRQ